MTSHDKSCSAQISSLNTNIKKSCRSQNTPCLNPQHQYIGGVVVPTPVIGQKFPIADTGKAQITPSSLSPGPISNVVVPVQRLPSFPTSSSPLGNVPIGRTGVSMSETSANKTEGETGHKLKFSQSGVLYTLRMIREPVVEYQETRGIPRNEEITFVTLVTSLCTQAYTAAITILVMLWNLMPLVDGLVYFVRFFLDKLIDIVQTEDNKDKAIKGAIFFGELTVVTFIIFLIVGLIFMPVYVLMARLFSKVFSMIAW